MPSLLILSFLRRNFIEEITCDFFFFWKKKISLYLPTYLFFWTTYQKVCYYQKIKNQPPFEYSGHLTFYHSGGGGSNPAMSTFDYLSMCLPFLYICPPFPYICPPWTYIRRYSPQWQNLGLLRLSSVGNLEEKKVKILYEYKRDI